MCCSPWGRKESDMTGQLNSNNLEITSIRIVETHFEKNSEQGIISRDCPAKHNVWSMNTGVDCHFLLQGIF